MNTERAIRARFHVHSSDPPPYCGWLRNTSREMIYDLFNELSYTVGAEIGVAAGKNALEILKRNPTMKLYLIDPWNRYSRSITESRAEKRLANARAILSEYNAVFIRMTSMDGVKEFADRSLDFVYIDGLHDFDNVMLDLIHWTRKVKVGGIISGHDYFPLQRGGVIKAVDAYCSAHGISGPFLVRENEHATVDKGKYPSFLFVNK